MSRHLTCAVGVTCLSLICAGALAEGGPATQPTTRPMDAAKAGPAPLSPQVKRGLAWLSSHQLKDGSWGQGEESSEMGTGMAAIKDTPNVADTCMALMALYNSGSTPKAGEYQHNIVGAVDFICGQVENADDKSLSITSLKGTRTQIKLGPNIDTFMAAQALAEMKGKMADATSNQRVEAALKKVLHKMELNQKDNGQWADGGWAPTLAQAEAAKAANIAVQRGEAFDEGKRMQAQEYARADYQENRDFINGVAAGGVTGSLGATYYAGSRAAYGASKGPTTGPAVTAAPTTLPAGNAGVALYSAAADIAAMQASANSNMNLRDKLAAQINSPTTQAGSKAVARNQLQMMADNDKDLATAQHAVVARMADPQFANGFGSDGGEEYLSYLNIGESLFQKGGDDWTKWAKTMADNLTRIQNDDGSWSGGHCITGRTFCTAAAIQVLCIDRSPIVMHPTTQPVAK